MIAATIACGCAVAVLLAAEARAWGAVRAIAKVIASLAFLGCGILAATTGGLPAAPWQSFACTVVAGLAAGVVGDTALLGRGRTPFTLGLVAFLIGHGLYVVAAVRRAPDASWLSPWDLAPLAVGVVALARLWPHLGGLRVPVAFYVATIVAMMVGAIGIAREAPLFTVGASLFFASDLAVARERFVTQSFANKAWGLPAYYAGQLLIAWSLA